MPTNAYHTSVLEAAKCLSSSPVDAKVLHLNVRGISDINKFNSLRALIDTLDVLIDVIVFTEVKLKSNFPIALYSLRGFNQFSCLRSLQGGGGVIVYIRSNIAAENVCVSSFSSEKVLLNLKFGLSNFRMIAYYRAPCYKNLPEFIEDLEKELSSTDRKTFVIGEININSETLSICQPIMDASSRQYSELLESYGYKVTNNLPTRRASGKVIDHFVTNFHDTLQVHNDTIEVDDSLSDHNIVVSTITFSHNIPRQQGKITRRKVDNLRLVENFPDVHEIVLNCPDADETAEILVGAIKVAVDRSSVVRQFTVKHAEKISDWTSSRTIKLMNEKDKWLRKRRAKPASEKYRKKLREISSILTSLNKSDYEQYITQKVSTRDPKKLWRGLNEVLGRNYNPNTPSLAHNKTTVSDQTLVANLFNKYFISCAQDLVQSANFPSVEQAVELQPLESMFLNSPDVTEIVNIIKTMKPNAAAGYDGIAPLTIKSLIQPLAPLLVHLIDIIFATGSYPSCLKIALVTPVFKSGCKTSVDNYRPISVLSIINKIVERVIYVRLSGFFCGHLNMIYSHQFGFRQQSGTENAAIELTNSLLRTIDEGKFATAVFMDLRKAFDIVDHHLLLDVLHRYGVRGNAHAVFTSYLRDRHQIVKIGDNISEKAEITTGVVQGSCLGPLLFLIFINALGSLKLVGRLFLFADDALLINTHEKLDISTNVEVVQRDMAKILDFFLQRKMLLNAAKTNFVVFSSSARKLAFPYSIDIAENLSINRIESAKYLGLNYHEHMTWNKHIESVEKKIAPANGVLWKLRNILPFHAKKLVYDSLLQSHLSFMSAVWGLAPFDALSNAQVLQNRALRNVYDLPFRANRVEMYTHRVENHLPIRGICLLNIAMFMYKSLHNTTVTNISYATAGAVHSRQLRNSSQLRPAIKKKSFGAKSIETIGPEIFNAIPDEIKGARNQQAFKWTLKCHLRSEKFIASCFDKTFYKLIL